MRSTTTSAERQKVQSYPLRLPKTIRQQLEMKAQLSHRSLNGEILMRLERTLFEGVQA